MKGTENDALYMSIQLEPFTVKATTNLSHSAIQREPMRHVS